MPWRLIGVALVVLVVVAAAASVRALTLSAPALSARRVLPLSIVLPGPKPRLAWPATGEAAADVVGMPPLGASGPDKELPIASLAKVMTAYVILQDHPLPVGQPGFTVTVDPSDVSDYQQRLARSESVVAVSDGEALSELQLLQGLLVASGNNVAAILANFDSRTVQGFVARMNAAAKRLGMLHTKYTDPSGLESTTVSDAVDELILAGKAMAIPVFAQVVDMATVTLPVAGTVSNFNRAVGTGGYIGIKTGSDASSGGCLMFANVQRVGGRAVKVLGVVLDQGAGEQSTGSLVDAAVNASSALVHSVLSALAVRTVLAAGTVAVVLRNADGHSVSAATAGPLTALAFAGTAVPVTVTMAALGVNLARGERVATVSLAGQGRDTIVMATTAMPSVTFNWRLKHIL